MLLIPYQTFKINSNTSLKSMKHWQISHLSKYMLIIFRTVTFKVKIGFHLKLATAKTNSKNGSNVPQLELTEVVLIDWIIVNNQYQYDSRDVSILVPSNPFDHLLNISPLNQISTEAFYLEFSCTEVCFTVEYYMP